MKVSPNKWQGHGLKPWIEAAKKRLHHNVLAIALANKLARIAWSVLARGRGFEANSSKRPNHWQIVESFYPPRSARR